MYTEKDASLKTRAHLLQVAVDKIHHRANHMIGFIIIRSDDIHMAVTFRDIHFKATAHFAECGKASLGLALSTTRGVVPSQLGAAQGPIAAAKLSQAAGAGVSPLLPPNAITGISMAVACVRLSLPLRPGHRRPGIYPAG